MLRLITAPLVLATLIASGVAANPQVMHELRSDVPQLDGHFGRATAVDGGIVAVGAEQNAPPYFTRGTVTIFERNGLNQWVQVQQLMRSPDLMFGNNFGSRIAMVGNSMIIEGGVPTGSTNSSEGTANGSRLRK
jgi:hypothetical protein